MNINKLKESIKKLNKTNKIIFMVLCVLIFAWAAIVLLFSSKANDYELANKQVYSISKNIRDFYKNRPGYWGLYNNIAIENKLTDTASVNNETILNAISKPIFIGQGINGSVIMPGIKNFDITYKELSKNECVEILSVKNSDEQNLALLSISVINQKNNITFGWGGENPLPITKKTAKNICKSDNIIVWHFE